MERVSFQGPKGQSYRVLHCSCSDDNGPAYGCEMYIQVDDKGKISVECTNCGERYSLSAVVEKANEK